MQIQKKMRFFNFYRWLLFKKISNNKSDKIEYFITSKKFPSHACDEIIAENDITNKKVLTEEKCFTKKDIEKIDRNLINQNLELKLLWHKINLNKNNIILPLTKIRDILNSLREEKYSDENYILKDISKIIILWIIY